MTHSSHLVFHDVSSCDLIHGGWLFTCLRAIFGLSVLGILVCIFASMLVYQYVRIIACLASERNSFLSRKVIESREEKDLR